MYRISRAKHPQRPCSLVVSLVPQGCLRSMKLKRLVSTRIQHVTAKGRVPHNGAETAHSARGARPCAKVRRSANGPRFGLFTRLVVRQNAVQRNGEKIEEREEKGGRGPLRSLARTLTLLSAFSRLSPLCEPMLRAGVYLKTMKEPCERVEKNRGGAPCGTMPRNERVRATSWPRARGETVLSLSLSLQNCRLPGEMKANGGT